MKTDTAPAPEIFTTTFLTGSGRNAHYVAQVCKFCHATDKDASKSTIQGKHWKVIESKSGFKTSEEAVKAAKAMKPLNRNDQILID